MASQITPAKRPFERNPSEPNGRGKWRKTSPSFAAQNQPKPFSGVIFRLLCPVSKFGSIIGKGGSVIAKIRQDTGAKVRIEETIPGCEERIVVITGSKKEVEVVNEPKKEDGDEKISANGAEDVPMSNECDGEKDDSAALEGPRLEEEITPAQKALLLVCDKIIEGLPDNVSVDEENKDIPASVRLLVSSNQVGYLLGKGGSVVKQMSAESGAQIRILPRDKLPLCASPLDDIVQITGGSADSARKALQLISQRLLENPPHEHDTISADHLSGPSSNQFSALPWREIPRPEVLPPIPNRSYEAGAHHQSFVPPMGKIHEGVAPRRLLVPPEIFTLRLLCTSDKVGSIIGKGGNIIKNLQHETGCEIKVIETIPDSKDRIIVISGPSHPDDRISPAQDAVLRVQERLTMASPDNKEAIILKLLVAPNQAGCLLGKGGSVIAEMRKLTGAHIRILGKDQVPESVGSDEVVQVTGEFRTVQEALMHITTKLRNHLFRDKVTVPDQIDRPFADQMAPFGPFVGRREPLPHSMFPNNGSFQNFELAGRPFEDRPPFGAIHASNAVPHMERFPPTPWAQQGREGKHSMSMPDYPPGGPHKRIGEFPGGSHSAVITNTTVDVAVPRALVPVIYGEDGGCLRRIREISEAKITITEPRPEDKETVIVISGTPDQTYAGQSLIQAFVMLESGSS